LNQFITPIRGGKPPLDKGQKADIKQKGPCGRLVRAGTERILAFLGSGAIVGELSPIDGLPRSASVVARLDLAPELQSAPDRSR
jgi:hypothetical protein